MSDIFQHNANKSRIAQNIADSYSDAAPIVSAAQPTQTPFEHQQLVKAQIANSFNTENALSSEELEKSADDFLEKGGKRAVIGEKRMFGGREYIKTAQGWKFHGKGGGAKATAHREGALSHNTEGGKAPVDHEKEAEKWANELHTPTKLSHGMTMTQIDEKHAHHSRQAQLAAGTHPSQRKDQVGNSKLSKEANKHKQAMDEGATEVEADQIARGKRNVGDHSGKKDDQPTSKHIGDMSATEMKAAADKLGIDTKGKSVKQVRKELTDANVDKQIKDFQDKKQKLVKKPTIQEVDSAIARVGKALTDGSSPDAISTLRDVVKTKGAAYGMSNEAIDRAITTSWEAHKKDKEGK